MTKASSTEETNPEASEQIEAINAVLSATIEVSSVKLGDNDSLALSLRKFSADIKRLAELFPTASERAKEILERGDIDKKSGSSNATENAENLPEAHFELKPEEMCIVFLYAYGLEENTTVAEMSFVMQQIFLALMIATGNEMTEEFYERPLSDVSFSVKVVE